MRSSTLTLILSAAVLGTALVAAPAEAVVRTSTGVPCTIVGTMARDTLVGTAGRDVICGRGGNDRINARGGGDVVDAGAGNDSVIGAMGHDTLIGGPGVDSLQGGVGDDRLFGGDDKDFLYGDGGSDVLRGGAQRDWIYGGRGDDRAFGDGGSDRLTGEAGNDVVSGSEHNDLVSGGPGADRVAGNDGSDVLSGDDGNDVVSGHAGDDDLSGGGGGDTVDGGEGFNVCDVPGAITDKQFRCVIDESKPQVQSVTAEPLVVDVSESSQLVRIRARVTDDTGVRSVQIGHLASLESGSRRDGVWVSTIKVPRFIAPGPRHLDIHLTDRVGRSASAEVANAYTVLNTVYDQAMPVVESLTLSTNSVDVRAVSKPVTATVRITDDLAGPGDVYLCPSHAFPTGEPSFRQAGACTPMEQVSGSQTDGIWRATLTIAKGAPSGTWNTDVWIDDGASNEPSDHWFGPDSWAAHAGSNEPRYRQIPGGAGAFEVLGTTADGNAPTMTSLTLTPSIVDTATGAVSVTARIAGQDPEGITGAGLFISGRPGWPDNHTWIDLVQIAWLDSEDFDLVSGTAQNGVWEATFVVPGGTPDGAYFIQASLRDSAHFESWVSTDSGWTTNNHLLTSITAPNHFVVANSE